MDDALRRAGWILVSVIGCAYMTFLITDSVFNAKTASSTPIVVRDVLRQGQHHLYGKMVVKNSCDEITESITSVGENIFELSFTTWTEPAAVCLNTPTERTFDAVVFAPAVGVQFVATLDKTPVPIAVYPVVGN